jgi:hypothetical protein
VQREVVHRIRELHRDGVQASHEHQQAEGQQVVVADGGAVNLPRQRGAQDVILRVRPPLGDEAREVTPNLPHGLEAALAVDRTAVQDRGLPGLELCRVGDRETEDLHEDDVREPERDVGHVVAVTALGDLVEDLADDLMNPRLETFDRARREERAEKVPPLSVQGRIEHFRDPHVRRLRRVHRH